MLKFETLNNKDPGISELFISYDGDPADVNATEMAVQMQKSRTNRMDSFWLPALETNSLAVSPCPLQSAPAQAVMEEEELKTKE